MQAARSADEWPVTTFARLLPSPARRSPIGTRSRALAFALLVALAALASVAASANALIVSGVGSTTVGLAPRGGDTYLKSKPEPTTFANAAGNPVLHGTRAYVIFWDPTDHYHGDWGAAIETYFQKAATASGSLASVFAVDAQYTDKSNTPASYAQSLQGVYTDVHAYTSPGNCTDPNAYSSEFQIPYEFGLAPAPVCLTSGQVAEQLRGFIAAHALPTGLGYSYYVLTPPGVTVCLDGGGAVGGHCSDYAETKESLENSFCSYHSDYNPGGLPTGDANTIVYAVIPWSAGTSGDGDLGPIDEAQRVGWPCQDDGIAATPKGYEVEHKKEKNKKEKEAFGEMTAEEKAKAEKAERLEGPHEQEPNQQECPTEDGSCDYGLSDLIINQISLEQQDMVTDPLLNAWHDANKYEATDECRFLFGATISGAVGANEETEAGTLFNQELDGGHYYLNDAFNLAAEKLAFPGVACLRGVSLVPNFTAPSPVNPGETVAFDGMGSDISLNAGVNYSAGGAPQPTYATYSWNFGDGSPVVSGYAPGSPECESPWLSPCAASVFHIYTKPGTYKATLTVTDVGGDTARTEQEITVVGSVAQSPATPGAPGAGAGGAATPGGASTTGGGAGAATVTPSPVAAAAVLSRALKNALRGGLVVRYSVNEQVAGHFEVLLSRATARRLGISGAPAVGLPAGTPPQVVIAKALLVTTAGGRSSIKIQFSKRTAQRLGRLHKVSLMLRLIVRNAASHDPATTTVLSSVTLD